MLLGCPIPDGFRILDTGYALPPEELLSDEPFDPLCPLLGFKGVKIANLRHSVRAERERNGQIDEMKLCGPALERHTFVGIPLIRGKDRQQIRQLFDIFGSKCIVSET